MDKEAPDESRPAYDAAVVLGAAVWPGGRPSPALERRVAHAVGLHAAGRVRCLIMTGGLGRHPPAEAALMRDLAIRQGVPPAAILVECTSTSTMSNARNALALARSQGLERLVVVSDFYHLPRARLAFAHAGASVATEAPTPAATRPGAALWQYAREAAALGWYGLRYGLGRLRAGPGL
ncbi:YdcF family protein [Marinivivus vitaminiproducens]|uniref:YdcF family protein n=1 Tax=Marinivivus vitaminiproducens TaxID=3035935 RepID=UPI0027A3716B|nr:YdcF family protein [Geminicoccaceae bacterium SCSIO 64248]